MKTLGTNWLPLIAVCISAFSATGCGPKYPKCDEDKDCHEHEYCVHGQCQACRGDQDCGPGKQCRAGRCEAAEGYCRSNADCPNGQECQNNYCVSTSSETTSSSEPQNTGAGQCQLESVYFSFDSDTMDDSARNSIQSLARCVKDRNVSSLQLTGHCDPRGTEEYNLALGDRRAQSVKRYLVSLGVEAGKVSTSSMGEEMAQGTDETGWTKDRRVAVAAGQ